MITVSYTSEQLSKILDKQIDAGYQLNVLDGRTQDVMQYLCAMSVQLNSMQDILLHILNGTSSQSQQSQQ